MVRKPPKLLTLCLVLLFMGTGAILQYGQLIQKDEIKSEVLSLQSNDGDLHARTRRGGTSTVDSLFIHCNTGSGAWTPTDGVFVDADHFGCWQGYNTDLWVFRTSDGARVWNHNFNENYGRGMDSDGTHIYFTSDSSPAPVYKINKGNWGHNSVRAQVSGPGAALRYFDGKVYVGTKTGNFEVFNANTLQSVATYNVGGTSNLPDMWVDKDYIFFTTYSSGDIYRVNLAQGNFIKSHIGSNLIGISGNDDRLIVGDRSNNCYYILDKNLNVLFTKNVGMCECTAVDPEGRFFYVYDHNGFIRVWDNDIDAEVQAFNMWSGYNNGMKVSAESNKLVIRDNSQQVSVYNLIPYNLIPHAKAAALLNPTKVIDDKNICYSQYQPYNISVNISSPEDLQAVSEVNVHLDYNTTNVSLSYNWTNQQFNKYRDPLGHMELITENCTVTNDGEKKWWVNFSVIFNFSFPHEDQVDCLVNITSQKGGHSQDRFPHLLTVENDLEISGDPGVVGEHQGKLTEGSWIRGCENLTFTNMTVRYQDSHDIYPDDDHFNVRITDTEGASWWDNESCGEEIDIEITSRNVTDTEEEYLISIEKIPGTGICTRNVTFELKIDADPPKPPPNLLCHAEDFDDRETENTKLPKMYVTWDEASDAESGLLAYYYSRTNNSGTQNGTQVTYTKVLLEDLGEGYSPVFVWCVDNVGNIGSAAGSGILVDLSPPIFSNSTPEDGSWHNHSDVTCSIEIDDNEGSGVDGNSIEYSVSADGINNFNMWIPAWISQSEGVLVPAIRYNFAEGEENYIKWRARDVTENDFIESTPTNIKVDITPVSFGDKITPFKEWYDDEEITSKITVSDSGSGVARDSLAARTSTAGPGGFGKWMAIPGENISEKGAGVFEVTVTCRYREGIDNFIMFRGTDMVGNPLTLTDKFNLKIDTTTIYFGEFTPDETSASDELEVECFISILDDGSGVDPTSVEYSVSTEGAGEDRFGPWKKAENVVAGNPTQVLVYIEFDWGRDNYVKWRADDKLATGYNTSASYRIWVNSEPVAAIIQPEDGMFFYSDVEIVLNGSASLDLDGDNLSYFWSSNIASNRSLGNGPEIIARLAVGNHTITLFVSDGNGYNVSDSIKVNVGERPKEPEPPEEEKVADILFKGKGGDSWIFYLICAGIVLLILVIVIALLVRRKKRKKEKSEEQSFRTPPSQIPSPYPEGQYLPDFQQGYSPQPMPGMNRGSHQLALPPGPQPAAAYAQPQNMQQFPHYDTGPAQALPDGTGAAPGQPGDINYLLPSFPTVQGDQDLNIMALPPGPDDPLVGQSNVPTGGLTGPSPAMPQSAIPGTTDQNAFQAPPSEVPAGPFPPVLDAFGSPPAPPPSMETSHDRVFPELDAFLTPNGTTGYETPPAGMPPVPPPIPPKDPSPETEMKTISMQCHSCGSDYNAGIGDLPAVVTCPHCQVQGMVQSL